jgi:hypothetical protein
VFISVLFVPLLLSVGSVYAWDDCPFGKVNDPYPGECGRYVDTDGDDICDRSQPAPEDRESVSIDDADNQSVETSDHSYGTDSGYGTDEEDHYFVEISGRELKYLTIQEFAKLWEVDENDLLKALIDTFNLELSYSLDSTIKDMRDEYRFSPDEAKDVAESLRTGKSSSTSANSTVDSSERGMMKFNEDNYVKLFALFLSPLIVMFGVVILNKFKKMKKDEK